MLHTLLLPLTILTLFVLLRSGDLAIGVPSSLGTLRIVLYGALALLALTSLILTFLG